MAQPARAALGPFQDVDDELAALLAEERQEALELLAKGRHAAAERILREHVIGGAPIEEWIVKRMPFQSTKA